MARFSVPLSAGLSTASVWQLLQLHRPQLVLEMAERLVATDPTALSPQLARVEALRQFGRLPEAQDAAGMAVALAPESDAAFYALAQIRGQQGHLQQAAAGREALRLDPLEATYHAFLAQLLYLKGQPTSAVASANAGLGLRLNTRHVGCLLWRALAQEQLDQPKPADADFRQLLHLAPTSALAHTRRGKQLLWRCEPATAQEHLAEALRLDPTSCPELVPLLRRARREQHWPAWLRRHQRQLRQERGIIGATLPSRLVSLA